MKTCCRWCTVDLPDWLALFEKAPEKIEKMIHFTCDCCNRLIDLQQEVRYVVRLEVFAAADASDVNADDDRDYLQEIEDMLTHEGHENELDEDIYQQARFDLCSDCRQRFISNPLGRGATVELGFSNN